MIDKSILRIGLLLDSFVVSKYVRDLIIWVQLQKHIEISHIIIIKHKKLNFNSIFDIKRNIQNLKFLLSQWIFNTMVWCEAFSLRNSVKYTDHFTTYDVTRQVAGITQSSLVLGTRGAGQLPGLPEDLGVDLLIDFSSAPINAHLPEASRCNIISLRYQNGAARQGPPGFWECYRRQDHTEFNVERVSSRVEAEVIFSGTFTTQFLFSLNQAHLYVKSLEHFKGLLNRLAEDRPPPIIRRRTIAHPAPSKGYTVRSDAVPPFWYTMLYFLKIGYRLSKKTSLYLLRMKQCWTITIISEDWQKAAYWKSRAQPLPRGRFWADPFLYHAKERVFCFAEEYIFKLRRGHIVAFEVHEGRLIRCGPVLCENFHLSFPFIFEYQGSVFMCPEASEAREIRVYRCLEFPCRWQLAAVLMKDVYAADSLIFAKNGRWWLLTNIDNSGIGDYCTELYLFHADSPLSREWIPHPQNPIKVDCKGGRNGGLIIENDKIFRIGQRQGFDQYGEGIAVYEIEAISEHSYIETLRWEMAPDFRPGLLGIHHLSASRGITVFDQVQRRFVPPSFPWLAGNHFLTK
jgi:hypothetical protein